MATIDLDTRQFTRFNAGFRRLITHEQRDVMQVAGRKVGAAFDEVVRTELPPPPRKRRQSPYWTEQQRRWWWATMHAKAQGKSHALPGWKAAYKKAGGRKTLVISGSYRRTGTMVRSLTYNVKATSTEVAVNYGTNRAYAKYVIDRENQAQYHQGNWRTLQVLQRAYKSKMIDVFHDAALAEVQRRINRMTR